MTLPADPFGRSRLPRGATRHDRVALLLEAFEALLAGELPCLEACMFLGGAGTAWLREGGDLERDFLRVAAPAGSHRTPAQIASVIRSCSRGATGADEAETIAPVSTSDDASDG
ncbi:hypothetical protein [Piscinibacter defluvii]|uniref:hypothetical protein n=1 Tax=Piscinibacter defluvii TaxID=1796922 RepID=UPI000FDE9EF2|nr:hypothetical protein [Piscinibacter defluvii]